MLNVECSPRSSRGVALVITLIMLAVITFMATTFLVLSRRESNSVTTNTDQTTARFTADSALERAKVELIAGIIATGNDQNFDLMVPTNYYNPAGFNNAITGYNPTNVNYEHLFHSATALTPGENNQNIANLLYNPRPPVLVLNRLVTPNRLEPRYYLDLNRNGRYDTNGYMPEFSSDPAFPYVGTNGLNTATLSEALFGNFTGDPEWIGVLRFPDRPHSADNPFLARWTYLVLPAGKTLDVNYLHNQAYNPLKSALDGFGRDYQRNQGVGTWEMNLAAFLYDLNTNTAPQGWGGVYTYDVLNPGFRVVTGNAFADAEAIYRYRLNGPVGDSYNLNSASLMFPGAASPLFPFKNDGIDQYSDGDLMLGIRLDETPNPDPVARPWPGADNSYHFFASQDFFDPAKTSTDFVSRLINASTNLSSYDRYTFYRMVAQLGTDSAPMKEDKLNLNYLNVDASGNVVAGMETNLIAWQPLQFFTNAAARMFEKLNIRDNNGHLVTVTNIPIWNSSTNFISNNLYTPAVHRVLQLAANIYDASGQTNGIFPTIFRPFFSSRGGTNIYISGYELVNAPNDTATPVTFLSLPGDVNDLATRTAIILNTRTNIYGVPWVIGAKKGFPNLNQIAMQSVSQMTRKVMVYRPLTIDPANGFAGFSGKQMFILGVSNSLAVEVWNSYNTIYTNAYVRVDSSLTVQLKNDVGYNPSTPFIANLIGFTNISLLNTGLRPPSFTAANKQPSSKSFVVPLLTNVIVLPDSVQIGTRMTNANDSIGLWNALSWNNLTQPHWGLNITNNLRCYVMDAGRVVDYVQLRLDAPVRDLTQEALDRDNRLDIWTATTNNHTYWATPGLPMSQGVVQQLQISQGSVATSDTDWSDNGLSAGTKQSSIDNFSAFLTDATVSTNYMQAPFTPTAKIGQLTKWEANDPLVHYLLDDLGVANAVSKPPLKKITDGLNRLNDRYSPWGGNGPKTGWTDFGIDPHMYNTALKDPLVMASDNWNFPTNKFPSVGWLGRVHRGTPWQTAYMKSADILATDFAAWKLWSGSTNDFMATKIAPIQDRQLFEVFTTSLSDNASRGQLSINQANLAAWSAALSGVIVLTNDPTGPTVYPTLISPAGVYNAAFPPLPPLAQIVQGINNTRGRFANQTFKNLGDILATPEFTDMSPYLTNAANNIQVNLQQISAGGISDEVLERIPQQVMSLLTISHTPRFVVYAYGQTLRPANASVVTFGTHNGLVTNYQVTAETAVRAVIRVDGAPANPRVIIEQYNVLPPD